MKRANVRVTELPFTFSAGKNHVVAVMWIDEETSMGIRFESPEHLLTFCSELMEKAAEVWPNNQWIREYMEDDSAGVL